METTFDVVIGVISVVLTVFSILMGLLIRAMNKRDMRSEALLQKLIEGDVRRKRYIRATGGLAHHTAKTIQRTEFSNEDIAAAIQYYKEKENELDEYYQEIDAISYVKGDKC